VSREWKPGDVGVSQAGERFVVTSRGECFWPGDENVAWSGVNGGPVSTDRPLVIIDPEDASSIGTRELREGIEAVLRVSIDDRQWARIGDKVRDALRSLLAPPKPVGCPATLVIGGERLECEREAHSSAQDHRNDSLGQGVRWTP
jgi:hypothetical protein